MVTLYQQDFAGPSKNLRPGKYDSQDLGIGNNEVSSVRIPRGLRVTLYEGAFEGRYMIITQSVNTSFLNQHHFDNITSSVLVEAIPESELVVTIYSEKYSGISQKLTPGKYYASDLKIGDNQITSVKVPSGMSATFYEKYNFKGMFYPADRDTDFSDFEFLNNTFSSVIVEDVFTPIITPAAVTDGARVDTVMVIPVEISTPATVIYNYDPPCEMTDKEYYNAVKAVEAKPFSDEKMTMALLATKDKCMTLEHIRGIATLFSFEDQTLEFVKYAYDLSSEKSQYYTLDNIFKFMSSKEAFSTFLNSK